MSRRFSRLIAFILILIYLPIQSRAWGLLGHRIVGEIADSYLTIKAKAEIRKILGNESIAMSSNWADFIKSDSTFDYLDPWHYLNYKKGLNYEEMQQLLKKDTAVNAYTRINFLVKELKSKNLPQNKKLFYLRLLIHFVGDIHQPLHVSPEGTTGGNDIKLNWFSTPSNLHRVWDSQLIDFQQLSYSEYVKAINHSTVSERKALQSQPLSRWFFDSYVIAGKLHEEIKTENPRIGYEYNFDHISLLNNQLLKGGIHLAGLLNEIYK